MPLPQRIPFLLGYSGGQAVFFCCHFVYTDRTEQMQRQFPSAHFNFNPAEGPEMVGISLQAGFTETCLAQNEKQAITFLRNGAVETEISYRELHQDSNRMANALLEKGLDKGDRVIFFIQKSIFFVVAHLALQKIAAVSVPLNPGFKQAEMEYLLTDAAPKFAFAEPENEALIQAIDPDLPRLVVDSRRPYGKPDFFRSAPADSPGMDIRPDDPGLIIYTSGTTGKPKGAVLTNQNLTHDAQNIIQVWEISESDVLCHALPLFHVHGLCFALHTALLAGAHVLMLDRFVPQPVMVVLTNKEGPNVSTVFMAVPSMYSTLMDFLGDKNVDLTHMRLWTSGSAPLPAQDFERIRNVLGKEPVEREGMSETGMNFSNPLRGKRKPGSIGLPLPGLAVRIVDPDSGVDVEPGQTGEIWLQGPGVTPGYWRKPEETGQAFMQGWFRTGDLGYVDEDGYYYLTDRIKHIIISGGENISPKEVETVLNRFEGVVESSVVGIPDDRWGEKVVAAVVQKTGYRIQPQEILTHCKKNLHDWKCPKEIRFMKALPRNTMGKVLKEDVKKLFRDGLDDYP
jgi:malonyl-CoA/methylmalonyl-CoA synthetase